MSENKEELLKFAYEQGYCNYENTSMENFPNDPDHPELPERDMILDGSGTYSWKQTVWELEDRLNVGPKDDWDQMGVYHIFEDSSVAYEKGATDALKNEEFNPESIEFLA